MATIAGCSRRSASSMSRKRRSSSRSVRSRRMRSLEGPLVARSPVLEQPLHRRRPERAVLLGLLLEARPHQRPEVGHRRVGLEAGLLLQDGHHGAHPGGVRRPAPRRRRRPGGPSPSLPGPRPLGKRGPDLRGPERRGRTRRAAGAAPAARGTPSPPRGAGAATDPGRRNTAPPSAGNTASGARHRVGGTLPPAPPASSMTWRALNPWSGLAGLPRDSWLLALATLVNRAGTMVIPFLALHFTRNLGFSAAQAGAGAGGLRRRLAPHLPLRRAARGPGGRTAHPHRLALPRRARVLGAAALADDAPGRWWAWWCSPRCPRRCARRRSLW